ncbi:hypothetical protein NUACC21_59290 [Scytonema sp. NUACC21]
MLNPQIDCLPYVLKFNGQDDHIVLSKMNIDYSQGFTIEAWVYYNSFKFWSRIVDFGNGVDKHNIVFANVAKTNTLTLQIKTTVYERITANNALETGNWMHLAATIDSAGKGKLFKNGVEIQSGKIDLPGNLNRSLNYIGRSNWTHDGYFDGRMAEVRLWNHARSVEELQQDLHRRLEGNETGLVGYWPLNEGTGDIVSHNGKIIGGIWHQQLYFPTGDRTHNLQPVLSFRGLSQYIEIKDPFADDREFTISLWVKPSILNDGNNYGIIGSATAENQYNKPALWLTADKSGLAYDSYDSTGQRYHEQLDNFFAVKNQWVHITWVKQGTEYKFYRDGKLFATKPAPNSIYTNRNTTYWIGRNDNFWWGQIAALSIWNYPRTEDEVKTSLYQKLTGKESGLVGYWSLDEGTGDTLANKVISKDGTIVGATWAEAQLTLSQSQTNQPTTQTVLNFNGESNYINCGDRINLANTSFTIEFWAKRNSTKAWAVIIEQGKRSQNQELHIGFRDNDMFTLAFYGDDLNTKKTVTDTEWHHWACVYDASSKQQTIYRDSEKLLERTAKDDYKGTGTLYIGVVEGKESFFSGQLTEVRIWKKPRTAEDIKADMSRRLTGNELGLMAYWPLNEGKGNIANDKMNITNQATIYGAAWLKEATIIKAVNATPSLSSVLSFDGVDDFVEVPYAASLNPSQFTLLCWVKVEKGQGTWRSVITSRDDTLTKGYILYAGDNNRWQFWLGPSTQGTWIIVNGSDVVLNTWVLVAATYDGSRAKLYINGELVGETVANYGVNTARPLRIAAGATEGNQKYFFPGQIAEIQLWNKVCALEEIQKNSQGSLVGNELGLVAYWSFNEGKGNKVSDKTSYGNHGQITGATWEVKKRGSTDESLALKSVLSFQPDFVEIQEPFDNNKEFTISLWVKPQVINDGKWYGFLGKDDNQSCKPSLCLSPNNSALAYDSYDTTGKRYGELLDNFFTEKIQWVHITWVKRGTEYKFYRNGQLLATKPAPETFYTNKETGYCFGLAENFWVGEMTEVSIWNIARSDTDIKNSMGDRLTGKESGLVGYWSLNEGSSNTVKDGTSRNNHGKITGAIWDWQVFFSNEKLTSPKLSTHEQKNIDLAYKLGELEQKNTEQDKQISELKQKNAELDKKISESEQRYSEQAKQLSEVKQKNLEQDKKIAESEQKNDEQDKQLSELKQKNLEQDKKNAELEQRNTEQIKQIAALAQKVAELEQKNLEQETQLSEVKQKNSELEHKNTELTQQLSELSPKVVVIDSKTAIPQNEWQQLQKLQPADLKSESYFGEETAFSGEWAIAGARKADRADVEDAGVAYVFQLQNKIWVQKQRLQPNDTCIGDRFGSAVAIGSQWAIIGARKADSGIIKDAGAAYVYQLVGGMWQQKQKLQPLDLNVNSSFGKGIAIHGNWAIIGASHAKATSIQDAGAAYVFHLENGVWQQKQKLQPQDLSFNQCFGNVIAMTGEWAIIGGGDRYSSASVKRPGGAYLYHLEDGVWRQKQKLQSPQPGIHDLFGYSVAISGEYALVGAVNTPVANISGSGSVYTYKLIEGVWQPQQTLQPSQPKYCAFFGATVAIANDIAVIGSTRADSSKLKATGDAHIFKLEKGVWQLQEKLQPTDLHYESYFGFSTPTDREWIFTTAAWANTPTAKRAGAVYVFASR